MEVNLTVEEKQELELQHKKERDRKKAYRMNVVLLRSEGWSQRKIAEALRISEDAVYDYLKAYIESKRLSPLNTGSNSNLNSAWQKTPQLHLNWLFQALIRNEDFAKKGLIKKKVFLKANFREKAFQLRIKI